MEKGEFIRRIQIILLIQKMIKQWSQGTDRLPTHTLFLVPVSSLYWPHSLSLQITPTKSPWDSFFNIYHKIRIDVCLVWVWEKKKKN